MITTFINLPSAALWLGCASAALAQSPAPTPTPASTNYVAAVRGSSDPVAVAANTIVKSVPAAVTMDYQVIQRAGTLLWADPTKAQAIADAMGEKAAPIFVIYGALFGPLSYIDPTAAANLPKIPAGYSWTILPPGANGKWPVGQRSVTIDYTAPAASPSP